MENIASFEWTSVFAEAVLFCGAVLVVLFEALAPKHKGAICAFALLAMVAAIIAYVFVPVESLSFGETLGGRGGRCLVSDISPMGAKENANFSQF